MSKKRTGHCQLICCHLLPSDQIAMYFSNVFLKCIFQMYFSSAEKHWSLSVHSLQSDYRLSITLQSAAKNPEKKLHRQKISQQIKPLPFRAWWSTATKNHTDDGNQMPTHQKESIQKCHIHSKLWDNSYIGSNMLGCVLQQINEYWHMTINDKSILCSGGTALYRINDFRFCNDGGEAYFCKTLLVNLW